MQGASPLASPGLNPRGTGSPCHCGVRRGLNPHSTGSPCRCGALRGACFVCRLPTMPLALLLPPIPLPPFPGGEGGALRLFYARGFAPCIPGAEPARHWLALPIRHPAGVCLRNLQPGAKPKEPPFHGKCRQPRRGGTGGEELRRLRWSSPPGQGNQVPQGEQPPLPPAGDMDGRANRCRAGHTPPTSPLFCTNFLPNRLQFPPIYSIMEQCRREMRQNHPCRRTDPPTIHL